MPPYTIEKTLKRSKLSQAVVPASSTCGGIVGIRVYHFPPAHNRPNVPVAFKRTRITRDPQQGAYCICACLRYSTWLDLNLIEWENQYVKLNNALSTAIFRFRYLRSRIHEACHSRKKEKSLKGKSQESVGLRKGIWEIPKDKWHKITRMNRLLSSSRPTAQISMPVSANITPSEIQRLVDVNQIKCIHFGHVEICSSTGLLIALVEFRPFTTMSEVSQGLFEVKRAWHSGNRDSLMEGSRIWKYEYT
ncbi:hypothetical protein O181_118285 [Austropuccinia psidii MF-1]|uniref:Uncharacterized protein n=1 Tax=Austropuccinia psidii MF-1 TaxID=1389203 RepID=A0A9Q3PZ85_9BASI|nr:hypothetical protein [Austropuccinia psidii MF-1]